MRCKVTLLLLAASFSQHVRGYCTEVWVFFFKLRERLKKGEWRHMCQCVWFDFRLSKGHILGGLRFLSASCQGVVSV